jgi:hypothetical protein
MEGFIMNNEGVITIIFEDDYSNLLNILYSYYNTGGPLHIITDDGNLSDADLDFCFELINKSDALEWLKLVMRAIIKLLRELPTEDARTRLTLGFDITLLSGEVQ